MVGWTLGTVEAILISILAGFSVDYVVHLAHAYSHSYGTVDERIVATFSEMGSPVFSGMCTSVLASLPLFACNLQFFSKFGTFLCLTIVFSWVRAPPRAAGGLSMSRGAFSCWPRCDSVGR
jgi:predicted RND superfamily exporter protein